MADGAVTADPNILIPQFKPDRVLNQDEAGRRITVYGTLNSQPTILLLEKTAIPISSSYISNLPSSLTHIQNIGHNDIYAWFLASTPKSPDHADLKLNLIHPCTEAHVKKYTQQGVRMITETPEVYRDRVRPYMQKKRDEGRLNWVWNIIEGRAEQEDILLRVHDPNEGFLLAPDLNWDRKTISSLHLLALVERRDIWSLRDLKRSHVPWLQHMRETLLKDTIKLYPELEEDQLKLYIHYQPTYYHFHIHIVNVALEPGVTQATGKAFGLENIISQLTSISAGDKDGVDVGMADVDLTYVLGEASELWTEVFLPLKQRKRV